MWPLAVAPRPSVPLGIAFALTVAFPPVVSAQEMDHTMNRATLKGVGAITINVAPLDQVAEEQGVMKSQIQTAVELQLRQAGIRVLPSSSSGFSGVLSVHVHTLQPRYTTGERMALYSISLTIGFGQAVTLFRDPSISLLAPTWSVGIYAMAVKEVFPGAVRSTLHDLLDRFINAYLEQNPKQ